MCIRSSSFVFRCDRKGNTALHIAAKYEKWAAASILLDLGSDLEAVNKKGETPQTFRVLEGILWYKEQQRKKLEEEIRRIEEEERRAEEREWAEKLGLEAEDESLDWAEQWKYEEERVQLEVLEEDEDAWRRRIQQEAKKKFKEKDEENKKRIPIGRHNLCNFL